MKQTGLILIIAGTAIASIGGLTDWNAAKIIALVAVTAMAFVAEMTIMRAIARARRQGSGR